MTAVEVPPSAFKARTIYKCIAVREADARWLREVKVYVVGPSLPAVADLPPESSLWTPIAEGIRLDDVALMRRVSALDPATAACWWNPISVAESIGRLRAAEAVVREETARLGSIWHDLDHMDRRP